MPEPTSKIQPQITFPPPSFCHQSHEAFQKHTPALAQTSKMDLSGHARFLSLGNGERIPQRNQAQPLQRNKKACFFWSTARQRNKSSRVYWLGRLSMWEPVWGISTTNLKSYLLGAHLSDDGQGAGCTATAVPTSWLKHCLAMKQPVRDGFTLKQANKKRTGVLRTDLGTPCRARSA